MNEIEEDKNQRILSFRFTIYLLHSYLESNLIILRNHNKCLVSINLVMNKKIITKITTKIMTGILTSDSLVLLLCLKLKWPQHQRHLLLKRNTNIAFPHDKYTISRVYFTKTRNLQPFKKQNM